MVASVVHDEPLAEMRTRTLALVAPDVLRRQANDRVADSAFSRCAARSAANASMSPASEPIRRQLPVPPEQRLSATTRTTPELGPSDSPRSRHEPEKFSVPLLPAYEIDENSSLKVSTVCALAGVVARIKRARTVTVSVLAARRDFMPRFRPRRCRPPLRPLGQRPLFRICSNRQSCSHAQGVGRS